MTRSLWFSLVRTVAAVLLVPLWSMPSAPSATAAKPTASALESMSGVAAVAAGYNHSCALSMAGGVACWGSNNAGQLGDNSTTDRWTPGPVYGLNSGVKAIAAGTDFTCAINVLGGVLCWGYNGAGRLGDNTSTSRLVPTPVSGLPTGVTAITLGFGFACALTNAGQVLCWGENHYGELGNGSSASFSLVPSPVVGLDRDVVAIDAGAGFACALTRAGAVRCWGLNWNGELGNGSSTTSSNTPVQVTGLTSGVTSISVGSYHACAVSNGSGLKCWGSNSYGEIGDGTQIDRATPTAVSVLNASFKSVVAGHAQTCAITFAAAVLCWGVYDWGEIYSEGYDPIQSLTPVAIPGLSTGTESLSFSPGDYWTACATTVTGIAKCWGFNLTGSVGDGTAVPRHMPVVVRGLKGLPLILLPGIMGSRLRNTPNLSDGRCSNVFSVGEVWPNLPALGGARYNEGLRTLVLAESGTVSDPPCNHITADGIFKDTTDLLPLSDFYGDFVDALDDYFPVYEFAYDWRLDLEQSADALDTFITSNGWSRVILVGHSMGGLLAKSYITESDSILRSSRVATVISVGSPYWGAPVMVQRMRQGSIDNLLVDIAGNNDVMRDIARNAPGVYQLLPSDTYFNSVDSQGYYEIDGHAYGNILDTTNFLAASGQNRDLLLSAQSFHRSEVDFFDYVPTYYYILAAGNRLTATRLTERSQCWFFFRSCWENRQLLDGDGAVPLGSSSLGVLTNHNGNASVCQYRPGSGVNAHGELVSDNKVIADIEKILNVAPDPTMPYGCLMLPEVSAGEVASGNSLNSSAATPRTALQVTLWGDAELYVSDAFGHEAKTTPGGLTQNDIPDVTYEPSPGSPSVIVPSAGVYTLTVQSTSGGPVQLRVTEFSAPSELAAYDPQAKAMFAYVDLAAGGSASLRLDDAAGLPALQLHVQNALGQETGVLAPDSVLTPADLQDQMTPATSLAVQGARDPLGFYTGPVTVSVSATDVGVGVELTQVSLDGGQTWAVYTGPLTLVAEQVPEVLARSMDRAGNQEAPGAAVRLQPYRLRLPSLVR